MIYLLLLLGLLLPVQSFAGNPATILMDNISTTRAGVGKRLGTKVKTVILQGYSSNGVALTTALPGTITIQCGPEVVGPWITCGDRNGNAIAGTANAIYDMESAVLFMRYNYTKTRRGSVKAWILGLE